MQNAVEECTREAQKLLRTIRLDLRAKLSRLSTDDLRVKIVSENILWDEQPALWLTVDARQPVEIFASLSGIFEQIRHSVQKVRKSEFRRYVLEMNWPYVVIVPLVRGKYANAVAWRISLPIILESENQELKWWNYAQHQIPSDALSGLKVEAWDIPQLEVAAKLLQSTSTLFHVAGHIRDFQRLPDLDDQGLAQLQSYVDRVSKYASEALQSVFDAEAEMVAFYNNLPEAERESRPSLLESVLAAAELHDSIKPTEDFETRAVMGLEGLVEWATRLAHAPLQALAASSAWMSDALDQLGI